MNNVIYGLNIKMLSKKILLISGFIWCSGSKALEVRGEEASQSDLLVLPPVCKLIVIERPGIHHSVGQRAHADLFDRPEYNMAKGNEALHHYCWALVHKQRYLREIDRTKREFRYSQFKIDIDYMLQNSPKDWPYFYVLYLEEADMLQLRGDYPRALFKIDEALRAAPSIEKAYTLKYDIYIKMGSKQKAIQAAQSGLDNIPRSKALRRRLEEQGIKPPPPPLEPEDKPTPLPKGAEASDNAPSKSSTPTDIEAEIPVSSKPEIENGNRNPPDNPYCRFCP